ncbi:MAG: hypothetical protein RL065_1698 [Bacteroidota bacterium]|jgi:hypothetical protein
MKTHFIGLIAFFAGLILLNSCRNDFDIASQWKEVPVVYCLLDADSSVQYIKVEKAFLDKSISAATMASNPDSIYYLEKLKVVLFATNTSTNKEIAGESFECELVKGDTIGLKKESGYFATSPNYFFRLKKKLNTLYNYNLKITKADGSVVATAQTNVISKTVFNANYTSLPGFSFYNPAQKNKILIRLIPSPNAVSADMVMRTYYTEYNLALTDSSTHYIDFNVFQNARYSNSTVVNGDVTTFYGPNYYSNLRYALKDKPKNVKRKFNRLDFIVYTGNHIFDDYRNVLLAQSGFTSGNSQPIYTNIVGGGLGIFASRNTATLKNVTINAASLDSLKVGMYTYDLGFDF